MILTTGKRTRLEAEYQAQVNLWAKACKVPPPTVRVCKRKSGTYYHHRKLIRIAPDCHMSTLVHEFAHHISTARGHGKAFRVALIAAATIAYGLPSRYPWTQEYQTIRIWAFKHGLVSSD